MVIIALEDLKPSPMCLLVDSTNETIHIDENIAVLEDLHSRSAIHNSAWTKWQGRNFVKSPDSLIFLSSVNSASVSVCLPAGPFSRPAALLETARVVSVLAPRVGSYWMQGLKYARDTGDVHLLNGLGCNRTVHPLLSSLFTSTLIDKKILNESWALEGF